MEPADPGTQGDARTPLPWFGAFRPRPLPAGRTLVLSAGLLAFGLALAPHALAPTAGSGSGAGPVLAWWQLAGIFTVAGIFVFHVEINSEAHTFSLSEVPLVLGLFFAQPRDLVIARLLGEAAILVLYERQSPPKLAFNLSVFLAESTLALTIFHALVGRHGALDPYAWGAALAAVGSAALLGASAVLTVIRLHGGRVDPRQLLLAAVITATGNTSLASVAAVLLARDAVALVPLAIIALVVVAAYRGYTRLTRRYDGLELLYQFTRLTSGPQLPEENLQRVLDEARTLLRARHAAVALFHPGQDTPWLSLITAGLAGTADAPPLAEVTLPAPLLRLAHPTAQPLLIHRSTERPDYRAALELLGAGDCLAAPLVSGGITGVMVVIDRLGEVSTFDAEDARLFATLASQAAIALENARLIERLHQQVDAREHEARHDALTGLPNRSLFTTAVDAALAEDADPLAVLLLDLNGFKDVNDTLGHQAGDQLLCIVASRLLDSVGARGTVARLGGDEFAVLLPHLAGAEYALEVAEEVKHAVRRPVELSTLSVEVGASIGVALRPEHGLDQTTLLQRADIAMYAAKRDHAGVTLYDPDTDANSRQRLRLAGELRAAIATHQIDVAYQPIARAVDTQVVSAEALVRWNHPELGRIPPVEFIPLAERTPLIHDLTYYVLDQALAQVRAWKAAGLDLSVAVNLSVQTLRDLTLPAKVNELLHTHNVPPSLLTFEITETGIMTDPERTIATLHTLANTGITFAIDDFGTGYSSLAYLQRLPVTKLKIDKSFVIPMATDPAAATIVRSVIQLARSLDLAVVAEGVEDQRTLDCLVAAECHLVQGYYLSRPIPAIQLTEWLAERRAAADAPPALRAVPPRA